MKKSISFENLNLQCKNSIKKINRSQSLPNININNIKNTNININREKNISIKIYKKKLSIYSKDHEIVSIYKNRIRIRNILKTQLIYYYSSNTYKNSKLIQELFFTLYLYIYYNIINRIVYNSHYIFVLLIHIELYIILSSFIGYYTKKYIKKSDEWRLNESKYEEKTNPPEWRIELQCDDIVNIYVCNFLMVVCDAYNVDVLSDIIKVYIIYLYSVGNVENNMLRKVGLIVSMICFIISDIDFNIDTINHIDKLESLQIHNFILDKNNYLSYFNLGLCISLTCFLSKIIPSFIKIF
jgi:hypothetical protein